MGNPSGKYNHTTSFISSQVFQINTLLCIVSGGGCGSPCVHVEQNVVSPHCSTRGGYFTCAAESCGGRMHPAIMQHRPSKIQRNKKMSPTSFENLKLRFSIPALNTSTSSTRPKLLKRWIYALPQKVVN